MNTPIYIPLPLSSQLLGIPPNATDSKVTDQDILDCLPTRATTFDIWASDITRQLSEKTTESLGFFEASNLVKYTNKPAAWQLDST